MDSFYSFLVSMFSLVNWSQIFYLESIKQYCLQSVFSKPIHVSFSDWVIFFFKLNKMLSALRGWFKQTVLVNDSDLVIYFKNRMYIQTIFLFHFTEDVLHLEAVHIFVLRFSTKLKAVCK